MKSSTLLVILVLQAILVMGTFAAVAEESDAVAAGKASSAKGKCCSNCNFFSGVFTCKDIVSKCERDCVKCVQVQSTPVKKFRCDDMHTDTGPASCGPPCKN